MARRRKPNERLPQLLEEAGWSGRSLAQAVNALGGGQGLTLSYDRTSVAHWVAGSRPRQPVPALVAQAFAERIGRLVTEAETGLAPPVRSSDKVLRRVVDDGDPVRRLVAMTRADADPQHHQALRRLVYEPALPNVPGRPVHTGPAHRRGEERKSVSTGAVTDMATLFFQQMEAHGGTHARTALATYLADDGAAALAGAKGRLQQLALQGEVARATHVLAMMCADSNLHGLAQRYYRTALELARSAGDSVLEATVLRAMSTQCSRLGHERQALAMAQAAMQVAQHCDLPVVRAFVLAQRAAAFAGAGARQEALQDLTSAEHELSASSGGALYRFTSYPSAALRFQEGQTLLALGDVSGGIRALEASVDHRAPEQRRARVLTRARLAHVRLRAGHVETGCRDYALFLDEVTLLSSRRASTAICTLQASLTPFRRYRPARTLLERTADSELAGTDGHSSCAVNGPRGAGR